jgi:hypothetical protein
VATEAGRERATESVRDRALKGENFPTVVKGRPAAGGPAARWASSKVGQQHLFCCSVRFIMCMC